MRPLYVLLAAAGGMVGAPLRFYVDRAIQARHDTVFPWGTLMVNVVGSLAFGVIAASTATEALQVALGAGFCGALTTYSTLGYETIRLTDDGAGFYAVTSVAANLFAGLGAAVTGVAFGTAL